MSSIKKVRGTTGTPTRRGSVPSGSGRSVGVITPTTRSDRGLGSNPAQKNDIDARYDQMLQNNAGANDFLSLLSSLGIEQEKGLTGSQRDDWNKQLLDTQLNYQLELEKRGYNEQMRDEQRIYDSPTNMLARLMGAGISRDAAIQMLSGAGGSQPIQTEGAVAGAGLSASESRANEINNALGIANTVVSSIGAVTGLMSFGFSVPQALQQTKLLKYQNYLTGSQVRAYQSTGQAYSLLKSINASADAFGSVGSAIAAITDAANKGDQDCAAFLQNGGAADMYRNVSFASQTMADMYKSERSSSDYKRSFENEMAKLEADTRLVDAQEELVLKQFELVIQEIAAKGEESRQLRLQNDAEEAFQQSVDPTTGKTGLELYTANRMQQLVQSYQTLARINNEEYWQSYANGLINNAEFMEMQYAVLAWFEEAKLDLIEDSPELFSFLVGMRDCGFTQYAEYVHNTTFNKTESVSANGSLEIGSKVFGQLGLSGGGSYSYTDPKQDIRGNYNEEKMIEAAQRTGVSKRKRSSRSKR